MNIIALAIAAASVILLLYVLLLRCARSSDSEAVPEELHQRREQADHRAEDEAPFLSADELLQRIQQTEANSKPRENVALSPANAADRFRCPACGAVITANDERCPCCEICFVADGSQKWTLGKVGPADGIFLPPTEFSE